MFESFGKPFDNVRDTIFSWSTYHGVMVSAVKFDTADKYSPSFVQVVCLCMHFALGV